AHADSLAVGRSTPEFGAMLEAFFKTADQVTEAHDGYADRGDLCAVVCVFGAPASSTGAADPALAAGRDLRGRLTEELPELTFGIGISVAPAVAGWIHATRR